METVVSMKRALILGAGDSGKTAFALKLAAKTGLPLFHLDALYWQPGWKQPEPAAWQKTVESDLVARRINGSLRAAMVARSTFGYPKQITSFIWTRPIGVAFGIF